jgi:hypothetical protein
MRRPIIQSQTTAVALGVTLVVAGFLCLYDAWEGRGGSTPWFLRPVTVW